MYFEEFLHMLNIIRGVGEHEVSVSTIRVCVVPWAL